MGAPDDRSPLKATLAPSAAPASPGAQSRSRYTLVFLIVASILMLCLCYIMAKPFVTPILFAGVMAIVFYPIHLRIWSRVRGPNLAALVSTLLVLVVVVGPIAGFGTAVEGEITHAYSFLSERSAEGGGLVPWLTFELQKPLNSIAAHVNLPGLDPTAELRSRLEQLSTWIVRAVPNLAKHLGTLIVDAAISFFTLFFLFREGRRIRLTLAALLPLDEGRVGRLFAAINDAIFANLYGVLAVAAVEGVLVGLAFAALGLGSPILWGLMTAGCSLMPIVGTSLVWVPAAIVLFAGGHWVKGVIMLCWGAAVAAVADHILRPIVIGGRVKMNTLFVFFSLLGGIHAFGVLGVVVGPLILAVTFAVLQMLREEIRQWQTRTAPAIEGVHSVRPASPEP